MSPHIWIIPCSRSNDVISSPIIWSLMVNMKFSIKVKMLLLLDATAHLVCHCKNNTSTVSSTLVCIILCGILFMAFESQPSRLFAKLRMAWVKAPVHWRIKTEWKESSAPVLKCFACSELLYSAFRSAAFTY